MCARIHLHVHLQAIYAYTYTDSNSYSHAFAYSDSDAHVYIYTKACAISEVSPYLATAPVTAVSCYAKERRIRRHCEPTFLCPT